MFPILKSTTTFWDITPCIPLKVSRSFRGTYSFHLQGRISHQHTSVKTGKNADILLGIFIDLPTTEPQLYSVNQDFIQYIYYQE